MAQPPSLKARGSPGLTADCRVATRPRIRRFPTGPALPSMPELTALAPAQHPRPYLPAAAKCRQTLLHAEPIQRPDIPREIAEAAFAANHRSSSRQNPL